MNNSLIKLLIIGDSIKIIGGVPNYTRPIFHTLQNKIDAKYIFTGAYLGNFTRSGKMIINDLGEGAYEIINTKSLATNYDNLSVEFEEENISSLLTAFIKEHNITHVHIYSMLGFPISVYEIIKKMGVKLYVTVHEYWWLCPHRVMIDFNGLNCSGPDDLKKCSMCVEKSNLQSTKYQRNRFIIKKSFPKLFKMLSLLKMKKAVKNYDGFRQGDLTTSGYENEKLHQLLEMRLKLNIEGLNKCDKVIAVSDDVEKKLIKYGVKKDKIIVQHIGSTIAEKQIASDKVTNPEHIVLGYIGGVGYYKGVHVLAEAFSLLSAEEKAKVQVDIYGRGDNNYIDSIRKTYLNGSADTNFCFRGAYYPQDLEAITKNIDIMVLPSLCADTAPQTIFESYSAGIPIIAPNIGGFPDFVIDKHNGLLFEPGSAVSLKEKIQYIIEHYEMIGQFRTRIPKLKKIKENADELIELYKKQ